MMYLHYCKACHKIFILAGHQQECPKCWQPIYELKLSYLEYVNYSIEERNQLLIYLEDPVFLNRSKRTYRFAKKTKRYQNWIKKEDISKH